MPTAVSILQRLHHHRAWANEKRVEAAATLSPEELRRPQCIGQGSVWQSLIYMYAAEYLWLETILGDEDPLAIPVFGYLCRRMAELRPRINP